jgi:transketolase
MVEILATLYSDILRLDPRNPEWEERDRFILSKGHGALSYYSALLLRGFISEEIFATFQSNESDLTTHPVHKMSIGVESSNGSLGQGLSMGVGVAIAGQARSQNYKVYVMLGDGECNEGSVWEAAMSAANFKLDNLIAIVDKNDFQNDGASATVMEPGDLVKKWNSFGWNAISVDGHDIATISRALTSHDTNGTPKVLIAKTVKGKGFSFMENKAEWHHNRLTKSQYDMAIKELESLHA